VTIEWTGCRSTRTGVVDNLADDGLALDGARDGGRALDHAGPERLALNQRRGDAVPLRLGAAGILDRLQHQIVEELAERLLNGRAGQPGLPRQPPLADPTLAGIAVRVVGDHPEQRAGRALGLAVL
jgi:hypothetical protein